MMVSTSQENRCLDMARGHDLAQLHEGRPELLQRQPDPLLGLDILEAGIDVVEDLALQPVEDTVHPHAGDDVTKPKPEQDGQDLGQPLQAANALRDRRNARRHTDSRLVGRT